ncbi:MAG TPA: biotin transporter BioY [Chloroflexota bacterium]|nr:biotin transporter BioY [Chloroflexota bacterium]
MRNSLTAAPGRAQSLPVNLGQQALVCTFFAALVAIFARISIYTPLTPVPFTLQPMAIMLTGMCLGPWAGFFALVEYLVAGALGAPVFASGAGGWLYLSTTPTLGYLLSYPFAAYVVGWLAERAMPSPALASERKLAWLRLFGAGLAGLAVIYLGGNLYLSAWLHKGPLQTLLLGAAWFIGLDTLKAALAAAVTATTPSGWFIWRNRVG